MIHLRRRGVERENNGLGSVVFEMPMRDGRCPVRYCFYWRSTKKWKNEEHQLHQHIDGGYVGYLSSQRELGWEREWAKNRPPRSSWWGGKVNEEQNQAEKLRNSRCHRPVRINWGSCFNKSAGMISNQHISKSIFYIIFSLHMKQMDRHFLSKHFLQYLFVQ